MVTAGRARELVVISGKGGTGKTSLVASFAALAGRVVLADCDVDASDLPLVLDPTVLSSHEYSGSQQAVIDASLCVGCGKCAELCRFDAVRGAGAVCRDCNYCVRSCAVRVSGEIQAMLSAADQSAGPVYAIDPVACEGCGVCAWFCPQGAIRMEPVVSGEWFVSRTRFGPMVHARLGVAQSHSGKLVTIVREQAGSLAERDGTEMILIDGSPGIGCPVIASITGADLVLIVTEPTPSGLHDLQRVAEVARHFGIPAMVCVNKWDLNADLAGQIEQRTRSQGLTLAGRVRYDRAVTDAQVAGKPVVLCQSDGCVADIRKVWQRVRGQLLPNAPQATDGEAGAP